MNKISKIRLAQIGLILAEYIDYIELLSDEDLREILDEGLGNEEMQLLIRDMTQDIMIEKLGL